MAEKNLATLFQNRAYRYRKSPWLKFRSGDIWLERTWDDVEASVRSIGRGLMKKGIKLGDRVAIYSANRPEWAYADLAIQSIGGVTVPIYSGDTPAQVEHILRHSGASFLFAASAPPIARLLENRTGLSEVRGFALFDAKEDSPEGTVSLEMLMNAGTDISSTDFFTRLSQISSDDLSTILYTSGTTGDPKGVMLTHANILSDAKASASALPISPDDHYLSFLPLSHALERTAGFYTMLTQGASIAFAQSLSTISEDMASTKPTIVIAVPRLLEKIQEQITSTMDAKSAIVRKLFHRGIEQRSQKTSGGAAMSLYDRLFFARIRKQLGNRLRFIVSGGAPLSPSTALFFRALGIEILEGYGLSEAAPVLAVNRPGQNKIGTVGPALPGLEIKIASDGEILAKGPNVMRGYYRDPTATAEVIDADRFLHTGDIGTLDSEGFLKITDRKKELIITSGGKNIPPAALEAEINQSPLVNQSCVVGDKQKFISVLIVPNFLEIERKAKEDGIAFETRSDLLKNSKVREWFSKLLIEVNSKLPTYETLKKFELLQEELSVERGELTFTLKLRRRVILDHYASVIDAFYR